MGGKREGREQGRGAARKDAEARPGGEGEGKERREEGREGLRRPVTGSLRSGVLMEANNKGE